MSMPSDNQTPSLSGESAAEVIHPSWDALVALVRECDVTDFDSFENWLDEELSEMEAELDQFASNHSRYGGRR